ncbi:MAG: hemerythrin domain-containing protein [Xanthomonadaceae bacterium]|nr:hemerythrin domain-containing protein [Xanthomonadaceae bacterium]
MPRRGDILALSREHHAALILARDASHLSPDAPRADVMAMNQRIAGYWHDAMAAHFRHEEALLVRHPRALPTAYVVQLLDEHRVLAAMSVRAGSGRLGAASVRDFGQRLAAHVRFEERECFDALQTASEAGSA